MDTSTGQFKTIDEYINGFPEDVRGKLQALREAIKDEAPEATEAISYQMPTFKLNGKNLVHFGAWKSHIGFYPTPSGTDAFKDDLSPYKVSKGAVQFPIGQPLPLPLIRRLVAFRVQEERAKATRK